MLGLKKYAKQTTKLSMNLNIFNNRKRGWGHNQLSFQYIFTLRLFPHVQYVIYIFSNQSCNDFSRVVNDYIYYYKNIRIKGKINWMLSVQYRLKFGS